MDNFDKFPYFSDDEVKLFAYCPSCQADLNPVTANIVENHDDSQLFHIQCNKCKTYILALLVRTNNGLSSLGLITDLDYNDVSNFKNKETLHADEIIKIHQLFNQKDIIKQITNN